jgi:hypothetical protein
MKNVSKILLTSVAVVAMLSSCKRYSEPWEYNETIVTEFIPLRNFDGVLVGNGIDVHITKGSFDIQATGYQSDIDNLEAFVKNGNLEIKYRSNRRHKGLELHISMPNISFADFTGGVAASVEGFKNNHICINASGGSDVLVDADAKDWEISLNGGSVIDVLGNGNNLYIDASGGSKLKGSNFYVKNAEVDLSGASQIYANISYELYGTASGASYIRYRGNPMVDVLLSGASSIRRE